MIYLTQRLDHAHPVTASVTLPIDVRVKSRARVALNDGREAGLMLPRGLLLRGGDLLTTDDGSEVIEVIAAPESVSVVRCADPFLLARACYHPGQPPRTAANHARRTALPPRSRSRRHATSVRAGGDLRQPAL